MKAQRLRRRYDHRFQEFVHETGDVKLAVRNGVPRSTAREWARKSIPNVVTLDVARLSEHELRQEVMQLRERNAKLVAILRLDVVLVRVCEVSLGRRPVPQSRKKRLLLRAVDRSSQALSVRTALRIVGLSRTRYHAWKREEECELQDASSCPQSHPQQLTVEERDVVKEMVTSEEYRHVPTSTLAMLAQRLGKVFASATTWHRLVRRHGWRRPPKRIQPPKPRLGVRASSPDEIWDVDTSVVRLLDGSRAYLFAVIDNFSRRILAWRVSETFDPTNTLAILLEAGRTAVSTDRTPTLFADGGVENKTEGIDEVIKSGDLRRVLAQTEIACLNSLIESWWRQLKHQWLFLNSLDSADSVHRLAAFYVTEHNSVIPHSAFRGQTPEEMYFGRGDRVPEDLESRRREARSRRLAVNRARSCRVCKEAGVE